MYNSAYRIVGNTQDAEDVLQEAFTKAFSKLSQFNFEATFGAWLKRIVINEAINSLRKKQELSLEDHHQAVDLQDNYQEESDFSVPQVIHALDELPVGYRTVISLYLLEGYDHEEISQILNISVSTSISQLSRGKKKLRQSLENTRTHGQTRSVI